MLDRLKKEARRDGDRRSAVADRRYSRRGCGYGDCIEKIRQ